MQVQYCCIEKKEQRMYCRTGYANGVILKETL